MPGTTRRRHHGETESTSNWVSLPPANVETISALSSPASLLRGPSVVRGAYRIRIQTSWPPLLRPRRRMRGPPHKGLTAYGCWISPLTRFAGPHCEGPSSVADSRGGGPRATRKPICMRAANGRQTVGKTGSNNETLRPSAWISRSRSRFADRRSRAHRSRVPSLGTQSSPADNSHIDILVHSTAVQRRLADHRVAPQTAVRYAELAERKDTPASWRSRRKRATPKRLQSSRCVSCLNPPFSIPRGFQATMSMPQGRPARFRLEVT
jgi:hypothetical protein